MPLYDYECECGNTFDAILTVANCDQPQRCKCGKVARKIIALGHGGIWRTGDSLPWIRDVAKVLGNDGEPPPQLETIEDLRNYHRANPNVVPMESHPALPSSIGDVDRPPDKAQLKAERSRKAHDVIRNMRRVEVNSAAGQASP